MESVWKEAAVVYLDVLFQHFLTVLRKITRNLIQDSRFLIQIRTRGLVARNKTTNHPAETFVDVVLEVGTGQTNLVFQKTLPHHLHRLSTVGLPLCTAYRSCHLLREAKT